MHWQSHRTPLTLLFVVIVSFIAVTSAFGGPRPKPSAGLPTQGELEIIGPNGQEVAICPLKHTDVSAEISGFVARVTVTQIFHNPSANKIEAVYVFPLPQNSAVDDMTLKVNDRTIKGDIKKREEARAIYDAARNAGHVAALLDQERPNIFTQSVANIVPGADVRVVISYVETLKYEDGAYEFSFPMVVGPRYIPGAMATGSSGGGWSPDTDRVPDASRITPPVAGIHTPAERAGHDISIDVKLDVGVPIQEMRSELHDVQIDRTSASSAHIRLKDEATIPNKDFILRYDVSGGKIEDALLFHHDERGGFFTFILQPPDKIAPSEITPREIVFVIDTSGSQYGFPLEKSKKLTELALQHLNANDTFNIITFAGNTQILFEGPVAPTPANLAKARSLLGNLTGGGGTEMMKAINAALDPSDMSDHLRVVVFMTDGYVGNDMEIIGEVKKHANARVFSLGIGNSVNRFLIDKMAEAGRGENEVVTLAADADGAVERLFERIRKPLLTDVSIDWGGAKVTDVYPKRIPDLFSAKPVIVMGRYAAGSRGTIKLRGLRAGQPFVREIPVNFPSDEKAHDSLASLWARQKIEHLMSQDWNGMQNGAPQGALKQQITQLGLDFRLMTQFTSFVAVEEQTITEGGQARTIQVPVEMPDGVSREGVFGTRSDASTTNLAFAPPAAVPMIAARTYSGSGGSGYVRQEAAESRSVIPLISLAKSKEGDAKSLKDGEKQPPAKAPKLEARLSPELLRIANCYRMLAVSSQVAPQRGKAAGCAGVDAKGRVTIQLQLSELSAATHARLSQLGFELIQQPDAAKPVLVGTILGQNLDQLAAIDAVQYASKYTASPGGTTQGSKPPLGIR